MSERTWTKEPWRFVPDGVDMSEGESVSQQPRAFILDADGGMVLYELSYEHGARWDDADMARAVACVNALAAFPDLDQCVVMSRAEADSLRHSRSLLIDCANVAETYSKYGLCDAMDNNGNPYPSQSLHDHLDAARKGAE